MERHFKGHNGPVTCLDFSPNMKQLASSSMDCTALIWNFHPTVKRTYKFSFHKEAVMAVAFSPNGQIVASGSKDATVGLWVPTLKSDANLFKAHSSTIRGIHFNPDGSSIATCSDDKSVKVFDTPQCKFNFSLNGHTNWVRSVKFAPEDGNLLVSCSDDKTTRLWDRRTKECVFTFFENSGYPTCLDFHPRGVCVATGSSDHSAKVWDIRIHKLLQHYPSHNAAVNDITFHPSGNYILTAGQDERLKIFDVLEGRLLFTITAHEGGATAVAFSKNGESFATGGNDSQVLIWNTNFDKSDSKSLVQTPVKGARNIGLRLHDASKGPGSPRRATSKSAKPDSPTKKSMPSSITTALGDMKLSSVKKSIKENAGNVRPLSASAHVNTARGAGNSENTESSGASNADMQRIFSTLEYVCNQLGVLTQSVGIIEERLSDTERKLAETIEANQTQNTRSAQTTATQKNVLRHY